MDCSNGDHVPSSSEVICEESLKMFAEGVSLVLSQWTALQMAIQNEWGGSDSAKKSTRLASDLFSWFTTSKALHYVEDLENLLDEVMVLNFNTNIEDGSIEEVAEQLMIMYEGCLQGECEWIDRLRNPNLDRR